MADIHLIATLEKEPVFGNAVLDRCLEDVVAKSGASEAMEKLVIKFRVYMLVAADDEQRNVLHIACGSGSPLIQFIVQEAVKMDVLRHIVNEQDELGQTPLYMLCMKGHGKRGADGVAKEHAHRVDYIQLLVQGVAKGEKANDKKSADERHRAKWLFRVLAQQKRLIKVH